MRQHLPIFHCTSRFKGLLSFPHEQQGSEFWAGLRWNYWTSILTNDSSLLLHAIHSPFYWRILKSLQKNPRNKKTRVLAWIAFCRTENKGRKPDKNSSLCQSLSMSQLNIPFKNSTVYRDVFSVQVLTHRRFCSVMAIKIFLAIVKKCANLSQSSQVTRSRLRVYILKKYSIVWLLKPLYWEKK